MQKEIEIKLGCSKKTLKALEDLLTLPPYYRLEAPYPYETLDTYLDTEDQLLLKQAASLRCRKKGDKLKVTFKTGPSKEGARLTRMEMEQEVSKAEFDALLEAGQPPVFCAEDVMDKIGLDPLKAVLQVINHRQIKAISGKRRGIVAEMSLDDVVFARDDREARYFGIEVELKGDGTARDLETIADGLLLRFPDLRPHTETKFDKGMHIII